MPGATFPLVCEPSFDMNEHLVFEALFLAGEDCTVPPAPAPPELSASERAKRTRALARQFKRESAIGSGAKPRKPKSRSKKRSTSTRTIAL